MRVQLLHAGLMAFAAGLHCADRRQAVLSCNPCCCSKRVVNMLEECRSVDGYEKLNRISEGTYGVVYRCVGRFPEEGHGLSRGCRLGSQACILGDPQGDP